MSDETTTKPGYKTSAFYLTFLATAIAALTASGADLGPATSVVAFGISGLATAGYAAIRAFKKAEAGQKPSYKTTEFWLTIASALVSFAYASGAIVESTTVGKIVAGASAVLAMLGYQVTKPKK